MLWKDTHKVSPYYRVGRLFRLYAQKKFWELLFANSQGLIRSASSHDFLGVILFGAVLARTNELTTKRIY